jgi:hypothetical protein
MTSDQFDAALGAYCRRRPFRSFLIEFTSGSQVLITHPEAVGPKGGLYVNRRPDAGYEAFAAESVARLLDVPTPAAK